MNQKDYYRKKINKDIKKFPTYIEDFFDTYYDILSPLTLNRYLESYKSFLSWLIVESISEAIDIKNIQLTTLENLSKKEMESYFKHLSREEVNGKFRSHTTINNYKAALRSLYKFLTVTSENELGKPYFERNVMLKIPINRIKETLSSRSKKISEKIFIDSQDEDFLDYVEFKYETTLTKHQKSFFLRNKKRDLAILTLFLRSGIRVNELASLKMKDIDFINTEINVVRKGSKLDTVIVTELAMIKIKDYLSSLPYKLVREDPLFITKNKTAISIRAIQKLVMKYTDSYNIPMSPHKLRHSYGTKLAEKTNGNIPIIMTQMGHSNSDTSMLYINESKRLIKESVEKLDN
ncbi:MULTISPECIES: tyrosine recombinase XerS [unclassified Gemella]|uniref:tyrosine recombinase XerS n=1 Tax=unclassified Gemella TaxID=2624949 RepID=UPI0010731893|nr:MULTISPECIES: tyrosine recombinase XerS [unclassified Gemella]MBF0710145.1 tyrosine recombinase XerS [Gemella sp. GL1.1]MBF0746224.1 tyrosine recombinase XerS [Gemella sp. 19428wG2_WT2a]NYS27489.1 tyrosine recombinase XerS [Gemella sp. GL1]TFU60507.1 tyrosine recombinase XerS [Gemella sp. WT2a]